MPKAQLTDIEYYRAHVAELKNLLLLEKVAKLREMRKNAEMVLEVTKRESRRIGKEKEYIEATRSILFMEIGKRLGATGEPSNWAVEMNHDTPTLSLLSWPEDEDGTEEEKNGENEPQ